MSYADKRHPIRVVARRTGTPETTLRAWERRYGAVKPERADTGRRLYSDQDIERLTLIRLAVDAGRAVSSVASLSDDDLRRLVEEDRASSDAAISTRIASGNGDSPVEAAIKAALDLDVTTLTSILARAALRGSIPSWIDDLVVPVLRQVGELWHDGVLSPRHEHLTTTVVRTVLSQMQSGVQPENTRTIIVATPVRQFHDLGTQFVATLAVTEGWNVINLGSNVPAEDIVLAVEQAEASVVALSIVHPAGDPGVDRTLRYLGEHLGPDVQVIVGGQAAESYGQSVADANGRYFDSARSVASFLQSVTEV